MGRQTSQESTITGSDRPLSVAASRRLLIAVGSVFALTIAAYATLWVNLPAGHQHAFGLHPPSIALSRALWPSPEITVTAERFAHAGTLLVALQWLLYLVAIACAAAAGRWGEDQRASQATVATTVLATVAALLFPTVLSADVYHYALQGRLFAVHGLNPYVDSGAAIADDPFYRLAVWRDMTTQYGPLWNLVAAAIGWLGAGDPVATAIGFKVVAGAAHVAATMAVVALAGRIPGGRADVAAILFGWNPILLQEAAGSGHNDSLMLALALAGVAALAAKRALVGVSLLAASIAVKCLPSRTCWHGKHGPGACATPCSGAPSARPRSPCSTCLSPRTSARPRSSSQASRAT